MTKKITWRLKGLPTIGELQGLVKDLILTKEEAREILFSQDEEKDRDVESLEKEIEFLRKLVTSLSERQTIVKTIEKIYTPYQQYPWYQPYQVWCGTAGTLSGGITTTTGNNLVSASYGTSGTSLVINTSNTIPASFDKIITF